jgi:glycosyltransferase involved in cell wall biosynthesis
MQIFHITDVYLRHGGGAPNVIKSLTAEQTRAGNVVTVLTFQHQPDWPLRETIDGVTVLRTPIKSNGLPFYWSGYRNMQKLAKQVIAQTDQAIIHVHMPFSGAAFLSQFTKSWPVIYTFHGSWPEEYEVEATGWKRKTGFFLLEKMLMRSFEKKALSRANKIVTLSKFMQDRAAKYSVRPKGGWEIVPAGVDSVRFNIPEQQTRIDFRKKIGISTEAFLVLTVRRLAKRMGLENLIDAIKLVKYEIPNTRLIIGGKGELEADLHEKIIQENLADTVTLAGFIAEDEYSMYLSSADIFMLPTQALEGFGLVILESMASGTPVVGTPVGAIPETIGKFNPALIADGTDSRAIAQAIINFYRLSMVHANELRIQSRRFAEGFSWEKMAQTYQRIYEEGRE